jgi:membrane protein
MVGMPTSRGKYPREVGKISFGEHMNRSARTAYSRLLQEWFFYGLLAVFPAITALVSLYGLFASPSAIGEHLSIAAGILPQGAMDILGEQITRLTSGGSAKLSFGFLFGLAVALWSANAGMKAIMDALNVVYEEKEKRSFLKLNLVSLAFTLAAIGTLLVALAAVVVLPVALNFIGLQNVTDLLLRLVRWPVLLILIVLGLAVLYRYGPSRREPRWQWISVGKLICCHRLGDQFSLVVLVFGKFRQL